MKKREWTFWCGERVWEDTLEPVTPRNKTFEESQIEEILPEKFIKSCQDKISCGWQLVHVESTHCSGYTLHKAKFTKYDNHRWTSQYTKPK